MNDFNRKNKIIGFKPYRSSIFGGRFFSLSPSRKMTFFRKLSKIKPTQKSSWQYAQTKDATRFMTEIIFIVVKTQKEPISGNRFGVTPLPRDEDCLVVTENRSSCS